MPAGQPAAPAASLGLAPPADPVARGVQIGEADRGLDVQPHAVAEELVELILVGAGELADVQAELLVGRTDVLADDLVVTRGVRLELHHQFGPVRGEQLDVAVAQRRQDVAALVGDTGVRPLELSGALGEQVR